MQILKLLILLVASSLSTGALEVSVQQRLVPVGGNSIEFISEELYSLEFQRWLVAMKVLENDRVGTLDFEISGNRSQMEVRATSTPSSDLGLVKNAIRQYCSARRIGFSPQFIRERLLPADSPVDPNADIPLLDSFRRFFPGIRWSDVVRVTRSSPAVPYMELDKSFSYFLVSDTSISVIGVVNRKDKRQSAIRTFLVDSIDADITLGRDVTLSHIYSEFKATNRRLFTKPNTVGFWSTWKAYMSNEHRSFWRSPQDLNFDIEFD